MKMRLIEAIKLYARIRTARLLLAIGRVCDRKAFELARGIGARVDAKEAAEKLARPKG